MVFGTFDIIHLGHIHFFKQAKKLGDRLVVIVSRDVNARRVKGVKPINTEKERLELLQHIDVIDKVILGDTKVVYRPVRALKPDVIALGYDQQAFVDKLEQKIKEFKLNTKIVRLKPYQPTTKKSSKIKSGLLKSL